jgi:hypothetical protein
MVRSTRGQSTEQSGSQLNVLVECVVDKLLYVIVAKRLLLGLAVSTGFDVFESGRGQLEQRRYRGDGDCDEDTSEHKLSIVEVSLVAIKPQLFAFDLELVKLDALWERVKLAALRKRVRLVAHHGISIRGPEGTPDKPRSPLVRMVAA